MRNPISVSGIEIEGGKFVKGTMFLPMKISEGKCTGVHNGTIEVDLEGVEVTQLLPYAGASIRIKVQNIREKGDEAVRSFFAKPKKKFHDLIARQHVEVIKLETAEDFIGAANKLSKSELEKLAAMMAAKLAESVEPK